MINIVGSVFCISAHLSNYALFLLGVIDSVGLRNIHEVLRSTKIPYISFEEVLDTTIYDDNLYYTSTLLKWRAKVRLCF